VRERLALTSVAAEHAVPAGRGNRRSTHAANEPIQRIGPTRADKIFGTSVDRIHLIKGFSE
jgi:hypothetical protein